jgi:hypothetical protein
MGILTVVEQVATTYKPSQNDNIFVVTAPTGVTSQNNVKILADVKDGSGNLLARLKAPIYYGTTNKAVFNISQILCDYVGTDWDFNDTESKDCQTQRFGYQIAFGYEYSTGTTSPIVPVSGDTTISSRSVFNAVLDPFEWLDYDQADYLMASGSTANFLTNNFKKRIHIDQKEWLYALHGSSIANLDVSFSPSGSTTVSAKSGTICRFPIGSNIPSGIPIGTKSYTITPKNSGGVAVGSPYTITIDDRCSKYESIDLFFVNRLGAVESFRFDMIHTKTHNVERKTYRKNPYSLNVNTYNYSKQGHTLSNYINETRERLVLNSNFITEEEAEWLQELVSSPKVWMYDGQIKGVTIVTNTYEEKQHVKDKVFNLTLEVEVSYYDVRR